MRKSMINMLEIIDAGNGVLLNLKRWTLTILVISSIFRHSETATGFGQKVFGSGSKVFSD